MVFGRQLHAPRTWTVGAAVRGLRYHFPTGTAPDPLPFASNVGAAYRRSVLEQFPFDDESNAAEDLILAYDADEAGFRAEYNPNMVVRHHDVATARDELRKNLREGAGWGANAAQLGLFEPLLAWGLGLAVSLGLLLLAPGPWTLLLFLAILWFPALRRALRRRTDMPLKQLLLGVAASPAFDLAFLATYVGGLLGRGRRSKPGETHG